MNSREQNRKVLAKDGARVVLAGLPFTQIPDVARDLSGNAFKILGRLIRDARGYSHCEITDSELARWINRCERTVQYAWEELETAGLVQRRLRSNRRKIVLLFTLAGRETAAGQITHALATARQPSEAAESTHALAEVCERTRRGLPMQPQTVAGPICSKEVQEEQQQERGPAAAVSDVVVSSASPQEEEPAPPGRRDFFHGLAGDLAVALSTTGAKKPAPGRSFGENPEAGKVRDEAIPDKANYTKDDGQPSRRVNRIEHKAH